MTSPPAQPKEVPRRINGEPRAADIPSRAGAQRRAARPGSDAHVGRVPGRHRGTTGGRDTRRPTGSASRHAWRTAAPRDQRARAVRFWPQRSRPPGRQRSPHGPARPDAADLTGRPVVDRTGLTGLYDFTLTFAYEGRVAGSVADRTDVSARAGGSEGPPCVFPVAETHGRQHVDGV
jgi:hypothetical protein